MAKHKGVFDYQLQFYFHVLARTEGRAISPRPSLSGNLFLALSFGGQQDDVRLWMRLIPS